ncbi:hypothetical protein FQA47_020426 [Oryzias melastigma]|uniref:Uncharacterized protein n=1 Tax=Oryzias melastigma TaxID=30732 RepID=A0A834FLH3_ORYME|nr:hypothetical protein FQA47_020426 [Oryzias melastigma]
MNVSTRPMLSLEGYSRRLSHFGCEERRDPRTRPGDQRLRAGPPAPLLQRREQRLAGRSGRNCFKLDVTRRKHDVVKPWGRESGVLAHNYGGLQALLFGSKRQSPAGGEASDREPPGKAGIYGCC